VKQSQEMKKPDIVWVAPEYDDHWLVIKNAFDPMGGNHYETVKSGFSTEEDAQEYAEEYNQVYHETVDSIITAIKNQFPYYDGEITKKTNLIKDLKADELHLTEIYLELGLSIGIDIDDDHLKWETTIDIFNSYKQILEEE
jgi:acyl carrier protein